jgi:DNA-binding transcriptional LysR family regulator
VAVTELPRTAFVVAFVVGVTPGKWARVWDERMPGHPLDLRPLSPAEVYAALASGEADAAFLRLPVDEPSDGMVLSAIPLYTEKSVVIAPKDHAIEALDEVLLADLVGENLRSGGNADRDWAGEVALVAANVGVAIMPQSVARALSRRDVVARPLSDGPETRVALVWPTDRTTALVEEFTGIVRGRTANSSRGEPTPPTPKPVRRKTPKPDRRPSRRR